jgi:ribonuclease HI
LGPGSNNFVELMALKLLLTFVGEKGLSNLQFFGDSMVIINWIRKTQKCHNIRLLPLFEEFFIILNTYSNFSIQHVYGERNIAADKLSKEGLLLDHGKWHVAEFKEGLVF